jgi:ABC-type methionine transport system ATPase subunit
MTAINNVQVPMVLKSQKARKERAKELLDLVGLGHRYNNKLGELSGGEQQRIAIAISLANNPRLLLADEPTGSLDTKTAAKVLDIFRKASQEMGITIVIVTHDMNLSKQVDRTVAIRDGRTSSEFISMNLFKKEFSEVSAYTDKEAESHVELAVVDSSGRLQLPKRYLDAIGVKGKSRVKVDFEDNKIVVVNPKNMEEENSLEENNIKDVE